MIDGDRAEFDDYDSEDYDMYNYDNLMDRNRRMDLELPLPVGKVTSYSQYLNYQQQAELRQRRPYRPVRRRPLRGRVGPSGLMNQNIPNRQNLPPIRAPELHKVPGRIQGLQIDRNHNVPYSSGPNRGWC